MISGKRSRSRTISVSLSISPSLSISISLSLSLSLSISLSISLEARDQDLPFTKGPGVFETTGAIGEETRKWWISIVEMEADQRIPCQEHPGSRQEQGLEHTWSANKF